MNNIYHFCFYLFSSTNKDDKKPEVATRQMEE